MGRNSWRPRSAHCEEACVRSRDSTGWNKPLGGSEFPVPGRCKRKNDHY